MKTNLSKIQPLVIMSLLASLASAQELQTEIYGKVHLEINKISKASGENQSELRDSASRAGVRAQRDLGDGFKGLVGAELSFAADAGTLGSTPLRAAYIGMDSSYGIFAAGRLDNGTPVGSPFYNQITAITSHAPNDSGATAWTDDFMNARNRVSNAIGYRKKFGKEMDIRARYYMRGTNNTSERTSTSFDLGLDYKLQNLVLGVGYGKDMKAGGLTAATISTSDFKEKNQMGIRWDTSLVSPYLIKGRDKYVEFKNATTQLSMNRNGVNYSIYGADYSAGKHTVALNFLSREIQTQLVGTRKMTQLGYSYKMSDKDILQAYIQRDGVDDSKTNNRIKTIGGAYLYRF